MEIKFVAQMLSAGANHYDFTGRDGNPVSGIAYRCRFLDPTSDNPSTQVLITKMDELKFNEMGFENEEKVREMIGKFYLVTCDMIRKTDFTTNKETAPDYRLKSLKEYNKREMADSKSKPTSG